MSFPRSLGKAVFGVVFTTFLTLLLITQNLIMLTTYDNLKPLFSQIANQVVPQSAQAINVTPDQLSQAKSVLNQYCAGNQTINLNSISSQFNINISQYLGSTQNLPFDLSQVRCSTLQSLVSNNTTSLSAVSLVSSVAFDSIYYKNYSCGFLQCLINAKSPADYMVVLSSSFNSFLAHSIIYLEVFTLASLVLLVLVSQGIAGRIKSVGWSMFSVGVIPFVFNPIENLILSKMSFPSQVQGIASNVISPFVNSLFSNFSTVFIIGIVLLVIGYSLGFVAKRKLKAK